MLMNKSIDNIDEAGKYHGYCEWYSYGCDQYWYRGTMFHGSEVGYVEQNIQEQLQVGDDGTTVSYFIK